MTRKINIKSKKRKSSEPSISRLDIVKRNKSKMARKARGSHLNRGKYTKKFAKFVLIIIIFILMTTLAGSVYAFSWLQSLNDELPDPEEPFKDPPLASTIYDRENEVELFKVIGDVNSDEVNIDELPEHVKWSFLAAEDVDFFEHNGFDTAGILRCGFTIVSSRGDNVCGGSTVTQQLIKITALRDETSRVQRKIKELFMSTKVEQQSTKDEILEMYLSVTPFGTNVVGIETAAEYYFGKEAKDLTLAESAILASIIQNPSYLSPTKPIDGDVEAAQERVISRQTYILDQMEQKLGTINGYIEDNYDGDNMPTLITAEQIQEAREQELEYEDPIATNKLAGHFVDFVLDELQTGNYKNGEEPFTLSDLYNGGYKVTTTLDYDLQKVAEKYAKQGGEDYKIYNSYNAALMTMLPGNGEILTMAGSKSFRGDDEGCNEDGIECKYNPEVNVLTTPQSPGSTNKPLAYATALSDGIVGAGSMLPDIPINIGNYEPKNWDSRFYGVEQTVRDNLRNSRNIPALLLLMAMGGDDRYVQVAREFGYSTYTDDQDLGPSVVLGGTDILPYEHAAAFTVFANQGEYVKPESIKKIEDRDGNVIFQAEPERRKVDLNGDAEGDGNITQGSFILNQILRGLNEVPENVWGGEIASKTGTTENNKDSLLISYTPDMVSLAWAGNNNNDPMDQTFGYPNRVIRPWYTEYLSEISGAKYFESKTPFARPGGVAQRGGECNDDGECFGLTSDWVNTNVDVPHYREIEEVEVCEDQRNRLAREIDKQLGFAIDRVFTKYILAYADLQGFLDRYVSRDGGRNGAPTDECDIERSGYLIESPTANAQIGADSINISGSIYAQGGLGNVQFFLDGTLIPGCAAPNYNDFDITCDLSSFGFTSDYYGRYQFRISADGLSNDYTANVIVGESTATGFNLTGGSDSYTWGVGIGNANSINLNLSHPGTLNSASLFVRKNGGDGVLISEQVGPSSNFTFNWGADIAQDDATYTFYAVSSIGNSGVLTSADLRTITVTQ